MMEREVKLRVAREEDMERIRRALSLRCLPLRSTVQRDVYFSHPCREFARTDEALRLRVEESAGSMRAELTYKGPRAAGAELKTRYEVSAHVGDPKALESLLERLGFSRLAEVVKRRESFECEGAEVSLDVVEGLGAFLEVEVRESEEAVGPLLELLSRLGVGVEREHRTYLEMLLSLHR